MNQTKNVAKSMIMVREKTADGYEQFDIYSRLMKDRIIMVEGVVDAQMASIVTAQLLYLQSADSDATISMYINSQGGSVIAGLAIYDTMQMIAPPIATYGLGMCASMGAFLLSSGSKGKRFVLPSTRVMMHQVSSGTDGNVQDMEIAFQETKDLNKYLYERLAVHIGKTVSKLKKDTERDNWMSAQEAVNYGVVDKMTEFNKNKWGV